MEEAKEEKQKTPKSSRKYFIIPIVVIIALALAFGIYSISSNGSQGTQIATGKNTGSGNLSLVDLIAKVPNGIHEAKESYAFHAGVNTIDISVGVNEGIVQNISVTAVGNVDFMSSYYIQSVDAALPSLVDGKRLDQINLPRQVSGSSLTTAAVNSYLHSLYE